MALTGAARAALALALFGATFALYAPTLSYPFAYDDFGNLVRNPAVRWHELSLENFAAATFGPINRRPFAFYSFGLNYYFGGYEPFGYRLVNALIHAGNGVLVFWLGLRCIPWLRTQRAREAASSGDTWVLALVAALLFALHPLQTNSVTYVVQRMNSLAAGFELAGLLAYLRAREAESKVQRRAAFTGVAVCLALACASKQNGITLPYAIALVEAARTGFRARLPERMRWALLLWSFAIAASAVYLLWGPSIGYAQRDFGPLERLLTQSRVVMRYLALIAWPHPSQLNLLHDVRTSHSLLDPPTTLASIAAIAAIAALAHRLRHRIPALTFATAWLALQLAVESTLLPLEMIYEHRTYLPLVGICLALPVALEALFARRTLFVALIGGALASALALGTVARNCVWSSSESLWADVIAKSPRDPRGYSNFGSSLQEQERNAEALIWFERALEADPEFDDAWRGLGASLQALDRPLEALPNFERAVALDPRDYHAWGGLGAALAMLGRVEESAVAHRRALAIFPDERIVTNYARVLALLGRSDEAIEMYLQALRLDRNQASASMQLGLLYDELGRPADAIPHLRHAARSTRDPEARLSLASALWSAQRPRDAIAALRELHAEFPSWTLAANNLAWMLATAADPELRDGTTAVAIAESLRESGALDRDTLAAAYASVGRFDDALVEIDAALAAARGSEDRVAVSELALRRARYAAREPFIDPASIAKTP